jgi:hypothetical protein
METVDVVTTAFEQIARGAASVLLRSARQIDSVLTSGSLENARISVAEAARRRAIRDALEDAWSTGDLSRTA